MSSVLTQNQRNELAIYLARYFDEQPHAPTPSVVLNGINHWCTEQDSEPEGKPINAGAPSMGPDHVRQIVREELQVLSTNSRFGKDGKS